MPDWEKIRDEYISDPAATYRSLGLKYGINDNVVAVHGKKGNWVALRGQMQGESVGRALDAMAEKRVPRAKRVMMAIDLILDQAIAMLQNRGEDELTPRELQQLADVVSSAREIYALSHEFTHFVEEMSPQKFRAFTDILFAEMGKSQVDVKSLIDGKMAVLKAQNEGLSESELRSLAYSEVVAEMMETAMTDTDVLTRISAKIKKTDSSLWGKIKSFLQGLVEKLKSAYKGLNPDSAIARLAKETIASSEAVLEAFSDAAADAVMNYQLQDGQKNTAQEGGRYSLRGYTEQQKKNWGNSKRIVIYDNQQQLAQFISDSIKDKTMDKKMYFGSVSSELAARIKTDTGVDVENYNLSLGSYEVRKILKDHGNDAKEAARGQRAVVPDDFGHITDVVLNPTSIALSGQNYMGKPAIIFSGENNGRMNVVAVVSDKRLDLFVQTVYTNVKKGNLATPIGEHAPINTPEANSSMVSNDKVTQSDADVKGNAVGSYSCRLQI